MNINIWLIKIMLKEDQLTYLGSSYVSFDSMKIQAPGTVGVSEREEVKTQQKSKYEL